MQPRKICVVTGSRAEYGLLYWLMKEIAGDADLQLQILATGMHLSPEYGLTYRQIEADGFCIDERVEMLMSSDTRVGIAKSIGLGIIGFADALERLQPDVVVLLGDRFEILAAAQAAMTAGIPIAHIHGGERTEGAMDEAIRHAVTKMAHLHFVAADEYRRRVVQLGEHPDRVCCVGAPGVDQIVRLTLLSRNELEQDLEFSFGQTNFLVTYHPVTLDKLGPDEPMRELFRALDEFPEARVIFTGANADQAGRRITELVHAYQAERPKRVFVATSLGQLRYLSVMKLCDAVIGNSSSGIIEAPVMGIPTVNMGTRQQGRIRAKSIIDCAERAEDIRNAIRTALSADFRRQMQAMDLPFGDGNASHRIKEYLKTVPLDDILTKRFYDLPVGRWEGADT